MRKYFSKNILVILALAYVYHNQPEPAILY